MTTRRRFLQVAGAAGAWGAVGAHAGALARTAAAPPPDRGAADTFPTGYYSEPDLPAIGSLARSYTVLDRYFASFAGETFPNRFYQHAARTDRDHNMGVTQSTLAPTIWDRLAAAGLS